MKAPAAGDRAPIVVVGGCGFIGSNLADSLLSEGETVVLVDDLSRAGVEQNLAWLRMRHGERVEAEIADVRSAPAIAPVIARASAVFHLAAQTAVTTSLAAPLGDFEVNGLGTLNVLEAARRASRAVPVIFASTNKVYGDLGDIGMTELGGRWTPADERLAAAGMSEARGLDFRTPYGCSKGVADQYVLDYARSYGLPTAVLRMSCIYGPRQFGTEDQGWVAHFLLQALAGRPVTIHGDGKQVRDVLHVSDAVAAYRALLARIDEVKGQAFNLGGGPANAVSLRAVLEEIARLAGRKVPVRHADGRPGDQLWFVADTGKLERAVGWKPRLAWREGIAELWHWLAENRIAPARLQRIVA